MSRINLTGNEAIDAKLHEQNPELDVFWIDSGSGMIEDELRGVDWQGNADYLDELLAAALQEWYVALFTLPLS